MSYQHILVTVDLSKESEYIIDKAVSLAQALQSKLSFIHIDVNYTDLYTGIVDINTTTSQSQTMKASLGQLQELATYANYPIAHTLVGYGDLGQEVCENIHTHEIDLVVCGHHQDFWSKWLSSTKLLMNCSPVDMLVVPLKG